MRLGGRPFRNDATVTNPVRKKISRGTFILRVAEPENQKLTPSCGYLVDKRSRNLLFQQAFFEAPGFDLRPD